mmetsp:Transcript_25947/g.38332  ORF Transcript_25947/g.38332 Transcript_25947/m.38332 type:complete len:545 (-) Transcript_25947:329-1963(-)
MPIFSLWTIIAFGLLLVDRPTCEASNSKHRSLISEGGPVEESNRYPYFALVTITPKSESPSYLCGGALVHSDIVVTAAQCYHDDADVTLRINASNRSDGIERTGKLMIPHEDYADSFSFDIMIIKLDVLILPSDVTPIKLFRSSDGMNNSPASEGDELTVMGFGAEGEYDKTSSDVIREVEINVGNFNQCNRQYKFQLDEDSTICTIDPTGGGKDTCSSDGGGPLIRRRSSSDADDVLIGITSFGAGCGRSLSFSGYTKVAPLYTDWIDEKICEHSLSKPDSCPNLIFTCFPGDALLTLSGKGSVKLADVKIGDQVLVGNGNYESIYAFGHYSPVGRASFLEISTKTSTLRLSRDHMVFVSYNRAVPASMLRVGDRLLDVNGNENQILFIDSVMSKKGAFAPFTASGSVVVNGIVASNYIAYQGSEYLRIGDNIVTPLSYQWIAHTFSSVHRLAVNTGMITTSETTYTEDGLSQWVHMPHKIFSWVIDHQHDNIVVSTLLIAVALLFVTLTRMLEIIVLSPMLLTTVVGGMSFLLLRKRAQKTL